MAGLASLAIGCWTGAAVAAADRVENKSSAEQSDESLTTTFSENQDVYARDKTLAVRSRRHPEYEALGVRAGAFLLFPQVVVSVAGDDNILATPSAGIADVSVGLAPRVVLKSDWNQDAFSLDASADVRRYAGHAAQNSLQYAVTAAGLLDVHHDLTVRAKASHNRTLLPRASDGYALFSTTPLLYDQSATGIEATRVFDRLRLVGGLTFEDYRYHDGRTSGGGHLDESFRNRDSYGGALRVDYALSRSVAVFVQETVTHVARRSPQGARDATRTLAGPNFEINRLIAGEIGVGYLTSNSTTVGAKPVGHFAVNGRLEYFPTPLITLTVKGDRSVIDSGLPNAPAYLSTVVGFRADYELLRNLILSADVGGAWDRYQLIDRRDHSLSFGLGATYQANRGLGLGLAFSHVTRSSSGALYGPGFDDYAMSLSVTLRR